MELGKKLRQARLEAGLSQRQLCGDMITRNMLSQIENGSANPSMATLQYLAGQLNKPVSYFLLEDVTISVNADKMQQARTAYTQKKYAAALQILQEYQTPDAIFDAEQSYLSALCGLALGEQLVRQGDFLRAAPLLEQVHRGSIYYRADMERQRKQLLGQVYQALEKHYRDQEDYKLAYECSCKLRNLQV